MMVAFAQSHKLVIKTPAWRSRADVTDEVISTARIVLEASIQNLHRGPSVHNQSRGC